MAFTLDPQVAQLLERAKAAGLPPYHTLSAVQARELFRTTRAALQPPQPAVGEVRDVSIPGPGGSLPLRLYRPVDSSAADILPVLVYYHGGGWTIGDLGTHDTGCRELANKARCAVVSVDYRMGPEHRFPAAVEDSVAALDWVHAQGVGAGFDSGRVAVGGDSAGGNLATVAAIVMRDRGGWQPMFQLLVYPATDMIMETPSHRELAQGYMLTRDSMLYFQRCYLSAESDMTDWRASPLRAASLAGLPPALVTTAGFDPLRDEGRAYADRLRQAGVPVEYVCYEGMIHGFFLMGGVLDVARQAIDDAAAALRAAFSRTAG